MKLKQVVHQKTLAAIDKRENEYRNQGLTIPIDDLVDLIDEEERRYGMPKYAMNVPIALYNTEVQQPMVQENLDSDLLEIEAELNNLCNDTEVNAAVAGRVRFQDKKDALRSIKSKVDQLKTYKNQNALSGAFKNATWDQATPVQPPRNGTPHPKTQDSMDLSESEPSRQSRPRDISKNANSRSDSEHRRSSYRKRSTTYDAYLRARSKSTDPESRKRALTPLSYRESKMIEDLKQENERLRRAVRGRSSSRPPYEGNQGNSSQSTNYHHGRSKSREYPSSGGYRNGRSKSRENGYGSSSYGSSYSNRGRSPHRAAGSGTIYVKDGTTVNLNLCAKCGVQGLHTPQMCNSIVAIRTGSISEN